MTTSLVLPENYGYVFAVLGSTFVVNTYLMINVSAARKKFKIDYPALYAPAGHKHEVEFNCVQRAHQNTLESMPITMIYMLAGGLVYPITAAAFGGIYVLGRFMYGYGYRFGANSRLAGAIVSHLGDIPLSLLMFKVAYDFLVKK